MTRDTSTEFESQLARDREAIEARLRELIEASAQSTAKINDAIAYTVLDGGKRLRPLLCLWTHDAFAGDAREACLDVAAAIECLHTYTLVHDDLPCMDDDDLRRGKPSCHKKFGEALAVLTGDALQTLCFEIIAGLGERHGTATAAIAGLTSVVARAAGTGGLITGQALDLMSDVLVHDVQTVEKIHRFKTAALMSAAMECGALVAGADDAGREAARESGLLAGGAFQIIDDVLDVRMDGETLGKTPGKDAAAGKLTYPAAAGIETAEARARELGAKAKDALASAPHADLLLQLIDALVDRTR